MTESADDAAAAAVRAAEQARLRKERREAKIKAGGANRLNKITGLGGGVQRDPPSQPQATSPSASPGPITVPTGSTPAAADSHHADPEEVDISQHYYAPQTTNRIPPSAPSPGAGRGGDISDDALRQMMLGFDPSSTGGAAGGGFPGMDGFPGMGGGPGGMPGMGGGGMDEDPMMKMLQQMMSAAPGGGPFGSGAGGPGSSPFGGPAAATIVTTDRYSAMWRLLHTAVALGLGLYIALWTSFAGTKLQRVESSVTGSIGRTKGPAGGGEDAVYTSTAEAGDKFDSSRFFWAFATAEAVLLTTRYFFDRARQSPGPGGVLGMVVGFLPPPFKGYVEMAMRYGRVFTTVRSDVLVCVFVLGVCAWLRG